MPRTKAKSSVVRKTENIKPNRIKLNRDVVNSYFKVLDNEVAAKEVKIQGEYNRIMLHVNTALEEQCLKFPHSISKTMAELKMDKPEFESLFESMSLKNISVNTTRALHKIKNHNYNSSTAKTEENIDSSLKGRIQSGIKKAKTARASRSLSRSKMQQAVVTMTSYNTPITHNSTAATFGLVTPKVKPNTPQVVLRRPKQGEIAISMQGSPLMVNSIVSDQQANVNIPLQDGRVLSIQPQRGLRTSQIPDLDADTKRQIETLRDNLNKVCALTARR